MENENDTAPGMPHRVRALLAPCSEQLNCLTIFFRVWLFAVCLVSHCERREECGRGRRWVEAGFYFFGKRRVSSRSYRVASLAFICVTNQRDVEWNIERDDDDGVGGNRERERALGNQRRKERVCFRGKKGKTERAEKKVCVCGGCKVRVRCIRARTV
jgi:hypothetical protein